MDSVSNQEMGNTRTMTKEET